MLSIRGVGKKTLGGGGSPIPLHVISFDFDSGVRIPVTLTFWPVKGGGNTQAKPPNAHAGCSALHDVEIFDTYVLCYRKMFL